MGLHTTLLGHAVSFQQKLLLLGGWGRRLRAFRVLMRSLMWFLAPFLSLLYLPESTIPTSTRIHMLFPSPEITSLVFPEALIQFSEASGSSWDGSQGRFSKDPHPLSPPYSPPAHLLGRPGGLAAASPRQVALLGALFTLLSQLLSPEAKPMGLSQQVSCPLAPWSPENTPKRAGPCYTHSQHPGLPLPST